MEISQKENDEIRDLCLNNPDKACTYMQAFSEYLQLVSCNTYHEIKKPNKSLRTIQYQAKKMRHVVVGSKTFLMFNQ